MTHDQTFTNSKYIKNNHARPQEGWYELLFLRQFCLTVTFSEILEITVILCTFDPPPSKPRGRI